MHFATFKTEAPVGHLLRALDELDRAGFALRALHVCAEAPAADVRIDYAAEGTVPAETYLARLTRMPGVFAVSGGALVTDVAAAQD